MSQNTEQSAQPGMKLDCSVYPLPDRGTLKALATIRLNDCFVVNGLRVMEGQKGLFVAMPSVKNSKGEYKETCFPVTAEFHATLTKAVLTAYEKKLEKEQEQAPSVRENLQAAQKEAKSQPAQAAPAKDKGAR